MVFSWLALEKLLYSSLVFTSSLNKMLMVKQFETSKLCLVFIQIKKNRAPWNRAQIYVSLFKDCSVHKVCPCITKDTIAVSSLINPVQLCVGHFYISSQQYTYSHIDGWSTPHQDCGREHSAKTWHTLSTCTTSKNSEAINRHPEFHYDGHTVRFRP